MRSLRAGLSPAAARGGSPAGRRAPEPAPEPLPQHREEQPDPAHRLGRLRLRRRGRGRRLRGPRGRGGRGGAGRVGSRGGPGGRPAPRPPFPAPRGGGAGPGRGAGGAPAGSAAATASGAASPLATSSPLGAAGPSARREDRQVAKSRISRLEMSSIMPPRPKRARRPVIVKSVTAATRVPPSCSLSVLTIVALAPPWPRLSVPRALRVAVRLLSSALSILIV